jgi:hypothetical protein
MLTVDERNAPSPVGDVATGSVRAGRTSGIPPADYRLTCSRSSPLLTAASRVSSLRIYMLLIY